MLLARVSTRKRSQEKSIPRQLAELRSVCRQRRFRVVDEQSDRLSGGKDDRPGLVRALALVTSGRADILIVHDIDRLGRDVRSMLANVDAIHEAGGHFWALGRNIDTSTSEGRLTFTIFAAFAEWYRRRLSEKVIAGLAFARKKGVRLGRRPVIPQHVIEAAAFMRRRRPRPGWGAIARQLAADGLGRYQRTTIAGAVTRCLKTWSKRGGKNTGKSPTRRGAAARV